MSRLQDKCKELSNEIEFLRDRKKSDTEKLVNKIVTIIDYDWMKTKKDGEESLFPCFIVKGDDEHYYYGGSDLAKILKGLDEEGLKAEVQKEGLPVKIHEKTKLKDGNRTFTKYETFPTGWENADLPF